MLEMVGFNYEGYSYVSFFLTMKGTHTFSSMWT